MSFHFSMERIPLISTEEITFRLEEAKAELKTRVCDLNVPTPVWDGE